ncbi:hypothetical protein Tco_0909351 [Tanacetum coccineum]|uniref:Retrovirus-related Pol polyprotein from transposon TNT 1-94-like beta-barrel domain-containing protein n=1 Tax=Tanacetum coccineum TaxID=301880 RepID=A0ABQ5CPQ4_9ASTR
MEKTRFKPKELLPYGMLLTRLFKHVVSVSPELALDHYLLYDRVMYPLILPHERKPRADVAKKDHDSGEEDDVKIQDETCLVAQAPNEICLGVDLEPDEWIKDSGCSKHMMGNRKLFSTYKAYNGGNVIFDSNLRGNIIGKGTISNDSLKIENVEHVDNLGFNLLSIRQICDNKCRVTFSEHDSEITKDGKVIGRGIRKKGFYVIGNGYQQKDKNKVKTDKTKHGMEKREKASLFKILNELIKSSVEDLVRTPSESDGISEGECDLPVCDDSSSKNDEVLDDIISIPLGNGNDHFNAESSLIESVLNRDNVISSPKINLLIEEFAGELAFIAPIPPRIVEADLDPKGDIRFIENLMYDNSFPRPLETLKYDSETVIDSNNDYSSSNDDSYEDIDYVDASPPDFELVSLEEVNGFHTEDGEIEDDILREKLSKINLLIAKIEALNTNPPPSSDFVTKFSSTSPNLFLEETNILDNSLTESETFCFDLEENSIGSTTTRSDYSLPDYEAFYFDDDHIKEKSSGSTTTHSDISLSKYDLFIFDLSNDPFPPADMSDFYHEEFADELAHIISPPEYECFYFKSEPDPGELTSIVDPEIHENISSTTNVNLPFKDAQSPLFAYVVWIFLAFLTYPVSPPYLLSTGNEDTIFDPDISIYHSFMPSVSHRSGTFMKFNIYPNHLNESPMEILSSTCSPMNQ